MGVVEMRHRRVGRAIKENGGNQTKSDCRPSLAFFPHHACLFESRRALLRATPCPKIEIFLERMNVAASPTKNDHARTGNTITPTCFVARRANETRSAWAMLCDPR